MVKVKRRGRPELKRTSVFLTTGQLDRLATMSEQSGVPVAVMIRRAVDAYLDERRPASRKEASA